MTYTYKLRSIKRGDVEWIKTFSPLEIGTVIGWGNDETEPGCIKEWVVAARID